MSQYRKPQCLRKAGQGDQAAEMQRRVFRSGSYAEALSIIADYVEVS